MNLGNSSELCKEFQKKSRTLTLSPEATAPLEA